MKFTESITGRRFEDLSDTYEYTMHAVQQSVAVNPDRWERTIEVVTNLPDNGWAQVVEAYPLPEDITDTAILLAINRGRNQNAYQILALTSEGIDDIIAASRQPDMSIIRRGLDSDDLSHAYLTLCYTAILESSQTGAGREITRATYKNPQFQLMSKAVAAHDLPTIEIETIDPTLPTVDGACFADEVTVNSVSALYRASYNPNDIITRTAQNMMLLAEDI